MYTGIKSAALASIVKKKFMRCFPLLILIIISCKSRTETDADLIHRQYMTFGTSKINNNSTKDTIIYSYRGGEYKVAFEHYLTSKGLDKIRGYLLDNPDAYGNFFDFDLRGKINRYLYLAGDGKYDTYRVVYSLDKDKYEEQGSAFVDEFEPTEINDTSNNYSLVFSTFPRKDVEASYSLDRVHYNKLSLKKSNLMPFLDEVDVVFSRKHLINGIIIKTKAKNLRLRLIGLSNLKESVDTLRLKD